MKSRTLLITVLAVVAGFAAVPTAHAQALPPVQDHPEGPLYMPGEVLIRFKAGATDQQLQQAVRLAEVFSAEHIQTPAMAARGDHGLSLAFTRRPVAQAIQALQNHPAVEYAEFNWVYTHQAASNDPYFTGGSLWGMYGNLSSPANQFGSQAAEAWTDGYTGSRLIVVGVIDEGIQVNHPDLAANIWVNPKDTDDEWDNDGNGYLNDFYGWNFVDNNNQVYTPGQDSHGTHVAGTIGAEGGNGTGVAGVNWQVQMISAKFLGPNGGDTANAIKAVDYFTDLKTKRGVPVVAINNSWGGGGYSQGLHDAILRAAKAGILFVAAAGNGNMAGRAINIDSSPYYPACYNTTVGTGTESAASYDAVISVTAIDSAGKMPRWANYGVNSVDLGAPGVGINSTLPTDTYSAYDGTSMATPHVTGAVALYKSTHPDATALEIKNAILGATTPTSSLASRTVTGGRLDLSTVITPPNAPEAPTGLTATAGDAYVSLSWNASAGATIYRVYRGFSIGQYDESPLTEVTTLSFVDTPLVNETTYYYVVTAGNSMGESPYSNGASATPDEANTDEAPAAPTGLSAVALSKSQIILSWTDNSVNESGFRIQRGDGSISQPVEILVGPDVVSTSDTGLSTGTTYTYSVTAYNSKGDSASVQTSVATFPEPSVTFVGEDATTQGTWNSLYGSQGYHIYRQPDVVDPSTGYFYVEGLGEAVSLSGALLTGWADPTSDSRGLQVPKGTERFAACAYQFGSFYIGLILLEPARVSLYCVDWDTTARRQTVAILDPTDPTTPLDTQLLKTDFSGGRYLSWVLQGQVRIKVTQTGSANAVLSGIFFDDPDYVAPPPPEPPAAPTGLSATAVSRSQINLSWQDNSTDETGFKVERSTSSSGPFSLIATVGAGTTAYSNTGLSRNTTYYYRVCTTRDGVDSPYSNVASAQTPAR